MNPSTPSAPRKLGADYAQGERRWVDVGLIALALVAAYAMKRHYSDDGVDQLGWILGPTAALMELVTGKEFVHETGVGYLSRESFFIIAKPCAGVNFLIVAFAASVFAFVRGRRTVAGKLALVAGSALGAYAAALMANTVRIAIAVELHPRLADLGATARERVHHAEGVVVYLVALLLCFVAARRVLDGNGDRRGRRRRLERGRSCSLPERRRRHQPSEEPWETPA